jgi:CPA1 family monovalent cation:H+ antiporter
LLGAFSQHGFSAQGPILLFIATMLGGIAVGAVIGLLASYATRGFEDPLLEITLTTIVAYGAYVVAETLHVSGVVAVVAAGLVVGNYGMRTSMSATTRLLVVSFWEYAAFLVNSIVFLLIGINEASVFHFWQQSGGLVAAVVAVAATLAGRAVVVYGLSPLASSGQVRLPWPWRHVLFWGGLHGALSMALALGLVLPAAYQQYYLPIVALTYSAVLFSLLAQGLTIAPLLSRLGFSGKAARSAAFQRLIGELLANRAGLAEVKRMQREAGIPTPASDDLAQEFRRHIIDLEKQIETLYHEDTGLAGEQLAGIRRRALLAEKFALHEAEQAGLLAKDDYRELSERIDETLDKLMQDESTDG